MSDFTWLERYTDVLDKLQSESDKARLALAIVEYGSHQIEPELEYPLDLAFAALRENIDFSRRAHDSGHKGGRPKGGFKTDAPKGGLKGGFKTQDKTRQDKTIQNKTEDEWSKYD